LIRLLAAFAAAGLLSAQLFSVAHFVLVPHHLCLDHGVLTHDDRVNLNPSSNAVSKRSAIFPGNAAADSHEHCSVPARLEKNGRRSPAPQTAVVVATLTARLPAIVRADTTLGGFAILSVAPKQSPPAITQA
jgi:hypothetical protein